MWRDKRTVARLFLDLENLVRKHWSMFDYSKHKELTKFSRRPTFTYANGESLRQIIKLIAVDTNYVVKLSVLGFSNLRLLPLSLHIRAAKLVL